MHDDDFAPVSVPRRDDAPSLVTALLFAGFLSAAIPAFIAMVLHGLAPSLDAMFVLGDVFAVSGIVGILFARGMLRQTLNARTMTADDRRITVQSLVAKTIAGAGAAAVGTSILLVLLLPGALWPRIGLRTAASVTGMVVVMLYLISAVFAGRQLFRCQWDDGTAARTRIPISGARFTLLLGAACTAFFSPIGTCIWLVLSGRR